MTHREGDDLDCPVCGGTHEVRRSQTVRVEGFAGKVPASLYVDCPEAGSLVIDEDGGVEAVEGSDEQGTDGERDDWP